MSGRARSLVTAWKTVTTLPGIVTASWREKPGGSYGLIQFSSTKSIR